MPSYEPRDRFYRKARAQGLPSRAAFKLDEILARCRLIGAGSRVLDLGCAPGGWLAILAPLVGAGGCVVGCDLVPIKFVFPNTRTVAGDISDPAVQERIASALGGLADLITSDMAPKLSGVKARDQARAAELAAVALRLANPLLRPDGAMVVKIFMDAEFQALLSDFKRSFAKVETIHPKASRPGSSELYLVARGFRPAKRQHV
jgi:23S rRNA (uridine2552-2'-O)-methyltransferase